MLLSFVKNINEGYALDGAHLGIIKECKDSAAFVSPQGRMTSRLANSAVARGRYRQ